jgi:hypothetical protein
VNPPVYSSITAFLAHRRALRNATARTQDQSGLLAKMETAIDELEPVEREALEHEGTGGAAGRHRQRAERHLIHILRQRGWLAG